MRKLKMDELGRANVAAFKDLPRLPIVLVLDNVRSALNVGAAFRTADAFAIEKIYLCGITAQPPHREILKTALGATETVEWQFFEETVDAVSALQGEGVEVFAVEQAEGSTMLHTLKCRPSVRYALVFGNEVDGVGEEVIAAVNSCLEVPQFGTKHSLNVAVCLGVVVWEFCRQIKLSSL